MKKIIITCLLLMTCPLIIFAHNWQFIGSVSSGNQYYIDLDEMYFSRDSGTINKNIVITHEKNILSPSEITRMQEDSRKRGNYHPGWDYLTYVLTYYEYDITNKTYAIKYLAFMNINDNIIAQFQQHPLKFKPIPSGLDTKEYNFVVENLGRVK